MRTSTLLRKILKEKLHLKAKGRKRTCAFVHNDFF